MADLTINASPRTIRLKGVGMREEHTVSASATGGQNLLGVVQAAGTLIPGALLAYMSDGSFNNQTVPDKKCATIFALENELFGLGIDDPYKQGDLIQAEHFNSGDWVLAFVAPAAAAIVVGSLLVSDALGGLKVIGATDASEAIAVSMDALNNSGGASIARIRVSIL
jgi:hypothetical protein